MISEPRTTLKFLGQICFDREMNPLLSIFIVNQYLTFIHQRDGRELYRRTVHHTDRCSLDVSTVEIGRRTDQIRQRREPSVEILQTLLVAVQDLRQGEVRARAAGRIAKTGRDCVDHRCGIRWIGRQILEVVCTEFRDRSVEYYVSLGPSFVA